MIRRAGVRGRRGAPRASQEQRGTAIAAGEDQETDPTPHQLCTPRGERARRATKCVGRAVRRGRPRYATTRDSRETNSARGARGAVWRRFAGVSTRGSGHARCALGGTPVKSRENALRLARSRHVKFCFARTASCAGTPQSPSHEAAAPSYYIPLSKGSQGHTSRARSPARATLPVTSRHGWPPPTAPQLVNHRDLVGASR